MSARTLPGEMAEIGMRTAASGAHALGPAMGRNLPHAFIGLLRRSQEETASVWRYLASVERLKVSTDAAALALFRAEADVLERAADSMAASAERAAAKAEIAAARRQAAVLEKGSLRPGELAPNHATRPKPGSVQYAARRTEEAVRIESEAASRMRATATRRGTPEELARATAVDRISQVVGPMEREGWRPVTEFLAENHVRIAQAERGYAAALETFKREPGAGTKAALARALNSRRGLHSQVKGALGEAYASRCAEWVDMREAFCDLAMRRAKALNKEARRRASSTRWTTVTVRGRVLLDDKLAWDEAVLVIEELAPGMTRLRRAELVVAAQYKVEKRVSALEQVVRDVERERGAVPGSAMLSYQTASGAMENFDLMPTGGAHRPTRIIFNADGGQLSSAQQAAAAAQVQFHRGILKASVAEFDAVADELMAAAAAVSGT